MVDISTVGTTIKIIFGKDANKTDNGANVVGPFKDFATEGTPYEIGGDVDLSTNPKNINGNMVSSRSLSTIPIAISVIPDGDTDRKLRKKAKEALITPNNATPIADIIVKYLIIEVPMNDYSGHNPTHKIRITYKNGRMKAGDMGPATSVEGRKSARTYVFEMEGDMSDESVSNSGSGVANV